VKKTQKRKTEDIKFYFWLKWERLKRNPDYLEDFDKLTQIITAYKSEPLSGTHRKPYFVFTDDEFIFTETAHKLKIWLKQAIPEFNAFQEKWLIAFPLDPQIKTPPFELLRYPDNEPFLQKEIEKVSDTESILSCQIKIPYRKVELALSFIKGYLEQNIPRNYKSSPSKSGSKSFVLESSFISGPSEEYDVFSFKARMLHTVRRGKITGTNTAQVILQIKKILIGARGKGKRESLIKAKIYYKTLFKIWDMRKLNKKKRPFRRIANKLNILETTAFHQYLKAMELICGKQSTKNERKQAQRINKAEIRICKECHKRN
jgi:hypothetical protein